jgi:hypothetical protein
MATTTTSTTFTLPRDPITKITGKPSYATVTNLRKELYENAMSVRSTQGGQYGHLGMIMPPNEYNAMVGAQPWVDPQNPGALQIPANSTARQMAMLSDTHNREVKEYNTFIDLAAKLKQQILDAVDHTYIDELSNPLTGFATVTTAQLLTHLMTRYCEIKRDDIKANKKKLAADWSPATTLEQLWIRARECQDFATTAGEPIPEGEVVGTLLDVIENTGVFATGCYEWRKRPINEHTLANFKEHFKYHYDERTRTLSAQAGGFHSANAVVTEQMQQVNIATTGTTPGTVTVDATVWGWCYTHGLTRNKTHTSQTCTKPCDGHKREATLTNPMGGSDKINFGNPRRNRRNRAGRESPANATANSATTDTTTESGGNDGNDGL